MASAGPKRTLKIEPILGGLALFLLFVGCFTVLQPFITALMWAMILAFALHPLQRSFTRWFRGSRTLAACFVTLTLMVVLAGPITLVSISVAEDGRNLLDSTRKWFLATPAEAPAWVEELPLVGGDIKAFWAKFCEDRNRWMKELDKQVTNPVPRPKIVIESEEGLILKDAPPPVEDAAAVTENSQSVATSPQFVVILGQIVVWARGWLISIGLAVTHGVTQVVLSAFLAFFFLRDAPILAERLSIGVERLAGARGKRLIKVAGDTVRGVIYGVLGTAIVQALVAGLGFWIAGVPGAVLLSVLTFFFAVMPFGPPLIWGPTSVWLFAQDQAGMGAFMAIWGLFGISGVDNFLRPYLISQGNKMPFVLIFCGVIGGAITFGLVGIFLGPTLLAIGFRLIEEWSAQPLDLEVDRDKEPVKVEEAV
jgi:predicted PurR-regulated permease PerM